MANKPKGLFQAQYYQSEASQQSPYAVTPDESLWALTPPTDYDSAMALAKSWAVSGNFKTARVVELNENGNPISVAWASAWEAPQNRQVEQGSTGTPGFACKLMVWMDRDEGKPDHWNWRVRLSGILDGNNNAWDLAYGRAVDTRGRMTLYSVKLNVWPVGKKHPSRWNWYKILGKDPVLQADEVEFVRAADIGPREFPSGAETNDCTWCGKTHLKSQTWMGWDSEAEDMVPFCSCFCIDDKNDTDTYRLDPDGLEWEEPGCEQEREKALA